MLGTDSIGKEVRPPRFERGQGREKMGESLRLLPVRENHDEGTRTSRARGSHGDILGGTARSSRETNWTGRRLSTT